MPIFTLPIVNKFGILPEQQPDITEKLYRKAHSNTNDTRHSFSLNRSPLQVNEEFVQNYNRVKSLEEQRKFNAKAVQMLHKIKWNAGLSSAGNRKHINVNLAWSELILLLKCKGDIQQECLDLLLMSLQQVSVDYDHVPLLLLLADTLLSLLGTHSRHQSFLRETHMKQLKVCQLVFMRLYYHKMANHLDGWQEVKKRLHSYFAGISEFESFYTKHPDAQLVFRFIIQVAGIILVDGDLEKDETYVSFSHSFKTDFLPPITPSKIQRESFPPEIHCPSRHDSWVSKSMHELSAPLWHALNVWKYQTLYSGDEMVRDTTNKKKQQSFVDSLCSLIQCSFNLDTSSCWVDYVVALNVLAEAAKRNLVVLSILQYLAYCSIYSNDWQNTAEDIPQRHIAGYEGHQNYVKTKEAEQIENGLNDVSHGTSQNCFHKGNGIFSDRTECEKKMSSGTEECSLGFWPWDIIFIYTELLGDILLNGSTSNIQKRALRGDNSNLLEEFWCKRQKVFQPPPDLNFQIDNIHTLCSIGLLELAFFKSPHELSMESDSWSWRIRLAAIQALMKVYQCLIDEPAKEVLLTTLWTILLQVDQTERNPCVLEALHSNFFYSTRRTALFFRQTSLHSFMTHLADNLVKIYLLNSHGSSKEQQKKHEQQQQQWRQQQQQWRQQQQQQHILSRNSLTKKLKENKSSIIHQRKDTCSLRRKTVHTRCLQSYKTRTSMNLQEVVRNQWDKENPCDLWEDLQLTQSCSYHKNII